ncbi:hypothetical protein CHX27_00845 [Flavobacterium aurantiibacter]|uniref:Uncharacterized protein n=2 Tax=Flavobacterium aurantiibacter TaxID=2023067 RepID=A0A256ABI5_9FLAO|nr:hypothetical protein CHX27_00845 [Flavobacterium aurantiibacter]
MPESSKPIKFISKSITTDFNARLIDSLSKIELNLTESKVDSNSNLYKFLATKFNFYDLYYYEKVDKHSAVIFYQYDYVKAFVLISGRTEKTLNFRSIAYLSGDGEDIEMKKSKFTNGRFFCNFMSAERSFSEPLDTLYFKFEGASKLYLNKSGKISEDTIRQKRNFVRVYSKSKSIESFY